MTLSPTSSRSSGGGGGGALALLSTTTPSGSPLVIDVTGIDQSGNDLILVLAARSDAAAASDTLALQLAGDTGAHYDQVTGHLSGGGGFAETGHVYADTRAIFTIDCPAANANAADWGQWEIVIPNYASATHRKFVIVDGGDFDDTDIFRTVSGGHIRNVAAVNEVKIFSTTGSNIVAGSSLRIYSRT